jgi:hypothetical protein
MDNVWLAYDGTLLWAVCSSLEVAQAALDRALAIRLPSAHIEGWMQTADDGPFYYRLYKPTGDGELEQQRIEQWPVTS